MTRTKGTAWHWHPKSSMARSQISSLQLQYCPSANHKRGVLEPNFCDYLDVASQKAHRAGYNLLGHHTHILYYNSLDQSLFHVQRRSSFGMGLFCRAERAFSMVRIAIPTRVSVVALPMWGITTHLISSSTELRTHSDKHAPGFLDQRMLLSNIRFTLNYIDTGTPNPVFSQRFRQSIGVYKRSPCNVHEYRCFLHFL